MSYSSRSNSGYKGVVRQGNRYLAIITRDRVQYRLGSFETPREAHLRYLQAAQRMDSDAEDEKLIVDKPSRRRNVVYLREDD